ncbi:hypothetical protein LJK88_48990 [Paenibacillus sp. P26]|nr:hypothetical protein LJK88_48990 [Paenibacillus sp. P26]
MEKPASGPLSHEVTGSGTIQAADTADLYVETNWPASDVKVKVGDTVEAGQELVLFKTRDAEDALKDNQAKWQQKRTQPAKAAGQLRRRVPQRRREADAQHFPRHRQHSAGRRDSGAADCRPAAATR